MEMHGNLNETQKELLGYLASWIDSVNRWDFDNNNSIMASGWHDNMRDKIRRGKDTITSIEACCVICGIPYDNIKLVMKDKIYSGLVNHNRLSYRDYYD